MHNRAVVTTPPTVEPLDLAEAKAHLRVDGGDEDDLIAALIVAARQHAEAFIGRRLITQTITWKLDGFDDCALGRVACAFPLQSVTSIKYFDTSNVEQTLSTSVYQVDTGGDDTPGRIALKDGQDWPDTACVLNAVTVLLVAGFGSAGSAVPAAIRQAMKLMIGHWFRNREQVVTGTITAEMPMGAEALLYPFKLWTFG